VRSRGALNFTRRMLAFAVIRNMSKQNESMLNAAKQGFSSRIVLKEQGSHPIAEDRALDDVADDEAEQEIDIAAALQNDARDTDFQHKRLRAQFGRRRTHNEELIVAPCGIILARQTFYGAEGVNSVAVCHHALHICTHAAHL
jgi:hypothetical protein